MSGHSKWSQIKRQKGAADAKRGQHFSKLANLVGAAAKAGGGDPGMNPRLRLVIDMARAANMPKDNIERAIKRGTGELGGATIEEAQYEVYGPGGAGILVDVTTDNRNRATAEIKATLNKHDGKLAAAGAVAYQFSQRGSLSLPLAGQPLAREDLELALIEAGAQDYEEQDDLLVAYADPKDTTDVKEFLAGRGIIVGEVKVAFEPNETVTLTDKSIAQRLIKLMETLEDLDDVTAVTTNVDIPADMID